MGCCNSDEGPGNVDLSQSKTKTGRSPKRSAKPGNTGEGNTEKYGSAIDMGEDNIFSYISDEA